jgi:tRNA U34 2-thiouridine synthase MnmA/TrmU
MSELQVACLQAQLMLTPDAIKDQTYFLAHLTTQQLARVMFPLGSLTKAQVSAGRQQASTTHAVSLGANPWDPGPCDGRCAHV